VHVHPKIRTHGYNASIDADGENGLVDLAEMSYQLEIKGVPSYLETSRRGGHLWLFFRNPQEGIRVRALGGDILKTFGMEGTELFPKQGKLQSVQAYL